MMINEAKTAQVETTYEIKDGINGSGAAVFCVFAMRGTKVLEIERFDNKAEAINWIKWS